MTFTGKISVAASFQNHKIDDQGGIKLNKPLADRIRPTELSEVVGQRHLLSPGKPLYNMIENGEVPNLIFYGPSGVGKTTVASIIAGKTNRALRKLNGTSASTQDIRDIVAEIDTFTAPNGILLYLDEIQYFNKRQQQSLLESLFLCLQRNSVAFDRV